jgi:hypothetical protein
MAENLYKGATTVVPVVHANSGVPLDTPVADLHGALLNDGGLFGLRVVMGCTQWTRQEM